MRGNEVAITRYAIYVHIALEEMTPSERTEYSTDITSSSNAFWNIPKAPSASPERKYATTNVSERETPKWRDKREMATACLRNSFMGHIKARSVVFRFTTEFNFKLGADRLQQSTGH
jgi:hypothetical protein